MFTGLVRTNGQLGRCPGGVIVRGDLEPLGMLAIGDSIAVDGVCLTVAEKLGAGAGFRADISEETLLRSTLNSRAEAGEWVNLEPALRLSDRLGGHLVSGHVDAQGTVRAIRQESHAWRLEVVWNDPSYGRYICDKASIALDGISLTVAGCSADGAHFWMAVIPHTWRVTTLGRRRVGDQVNLEADLLAKYTERLLRQSNDQGPRGACPDGDLISGSWLAEHGWQLETPLASGFHP